MKLGCRAVVLLIPLLPMLLLLLLLLLLVVLLASEGGEVSPNSTERAASRSAATWVVEAVDTGAVDVVAIVSLTRATAAIQDSQGNPIDSNRATADSSARVCFGGAEANQVSEPSLKGRSGRPNNAR